MCSRRELAALLDTPAVSKRQNVAATMENDASRLRARMQSPTVTSNTFHMSTLPLAAAAAFPLANSLHRLLCNALAKDTQRLLSTDPLDVGAIGTRLWTGGYKHRDEVLNDMRNTWIAARTWYAQDPGRIASLAELQRTFEDSWHVIALETKTKAKITQPAASTSDVKSRVPPPIQLPTETRHATMPTETRHATMPTTRPDSKPPQEHPVMMTDDGDGDRDGAGTVAKGPIAGLGSGAPSCAKAAFSPSRMDMSDDEEDDCSREVKLQIESSKTIHRSMRRAGMQVSALTVLRRPDNRLFAHVQMRQTRAPYLHHVFYQEFAWSQLGSLLQPGEAVWDKAKACALHQKARVVATAHAKDHESGWMPRIKPFRHALAVIQEPWCETLKEHLAHSTSIGVPNQSLWGVLLDVRVYRPLM